MSLVVVLNLPTNAWDYFPLPTLNLDEEHNEARYELIFKFRFPSLFSNFFIGTNEHNSNNLYVPPTYRRKHDKDVHPAKPELITKSRTLIESGNFFLCEEGVGGTYFVMDKKNIFSVFKPVDEEPGAVNNPKNLLNKPLMPPGGGAVREVAAYLLDRGFAGVPETHFIKNLIYSEFRGNREKQGSVQRFVPNIGVSSEIGVSSFDVEDVHRIGVLDIRLFNLDRNGENILVVKREEVDRQREDREGIDGSKYRLVPIDHTYCLPSIRRLNGAFFEWQYWHHAKKPFTPEVVEFIRSIDIGQDASILRGLGLSEDSILTMVVSTMLLKRATELGMTLFEISSMMTRKNLQIPSSLEEIITRAERNSMTFGTDFLLEFQEFLEISLVDQVNDLSVCQCSQVGAARASEEDQTNKDRE